MRPVGYQYDNVYFIGMCFLGRMVIVLCSEGDNEMKREQILQAIKSLAMSQGFYGRLYNGLMELRDQDEDAYDGYMTSLESQNFSDTVDMVLFFEC